MGLRNYFSDDVFPLIFVFIVLLLGIAVYIFQGGYSLGFFVFMLPLIFSVYVFLEIRIDFEEKFLALE